MAATGDRFPLLQFDTAELRWFSADGRAVQRLSVSDQCEVLLVCWQPGQQSSYHDHGGSESVVAVLTGKLVACNGSEEREVGAGQVLVTPRGVYHQLRNDGPEPASTLHLYAPPTRGGVSPPFIDHTTQT